MKLSDLVVLVDRALEGAPFDITDAWRIVRGYLRRRERPSQVLPEVEEPITAKQHFIAASEALKKTEE